MKPLSEVAPGLLVIQIQIQAVCYISMLYELKISKNNNFLPPLPLPVLTYSVFFRQQSI